VGNEDFKARLHLVINGESINAFAKKCGVAESLLRKYLSGQSAPGMAKLIAIAKAANVRIEWLATGEGPMKSERQPLTVEDLRRGKMPFTTALPQGALPASTAEPATDLVAYAWVPKVEARLSAGGGSFVVDEDIHAYYAFPQDWLRTIGQPDALVLLNVSGDSMEETLRPGDVIMLDQYRTQVADGHIYAFALDDVVLVKRLQVVAGGKIRALSDNKLYEPFDIDPVHDKLRILGQVVWVGRKLV
jgi:phage repressor protein C with HTH and peptisase S24 domain